MGSCLDTNIVPTLGSTTVFFTYLLEFSSTPYLFGAVHIAVA